MLATVGHDSNGMHVVNVELSDRDMREMGGGKASMYIQSSSRQELYSYSCNAASTLVNVFARRYSDMLDEHIVFRI